MTTDVHDLLAMNKVSVDTAEHYNWAGACDGWHLVKTAEVSVIQERVPPGKSETRHYHNASRQFFFVLDGEAIIEVDTEIVRLGKHEGLEIPLGLAHQFRNDTASDVVFLVVSTPPSHGDRVDVSS